MRWPSDFVSSSSACSSTPAPARSPPPAGAQEQPLEIRNASQPFKIDDPAATRIGRLVWRGGIVMTANSRHFGGWSDLHVSADGRSLTSISDEGAWLTATIDYDCEGQSGGPQRRPDRPAPRPRRQADRHQGRSRCRGHDPPARRLVAGVVRAPPPAVALPDAARHADAGRGSGRHRPAARQRRHRGPDRAGRWPRHRHQRGIQPARRAR